MAETGADRGIFALSLGAMIGLWALAAWLRADPDLLPSPLAVARIAGDEIAAGRMGHHLAATLRRVGIAFALAMALGASLGLALGRMPRLNRWADPWLVVLLNLPALVVVVMCFLWIGLNETAAIVGVTLNKLAMVAVTVREGARAFDPALGEMARLHRLGRTLRLRHLMLPQLAPYLATSARNGVAIIWKIVLVAEFLGRSDGIGFQIHLYFQLFETGHVLAYALSFVAVMLAVEYLIIQQWERHASQWRRVAAA
jgi:NitT/TauT family transport system permease protein